MAVKDDNQNNAGTAMGDAFSRAGVASGAPAAAAAAAPVGSKQPAPATFSFRNLGQLVHTPMGRSPAAEVLTKLQKALQAQYENTNQSFEITLIPIDMNQTTQLTVSSLVVCARDRTAPEAGVAFHALILEGSTDPLAPRYENVNNQNVEILVTMGEAWNDRMAAVVTEAVQRQFPNSRVHNADAEVVPRDFNIADERLVYTLAANAAYACSVELRQRSQSFGDLNLANYSRDEVLTVRTAFPKDQDANAVGHPVRRDITIDLQAGPAGQQNQQQLERTATVSRISGFLDLNWAPANPPANPYNPYYQQQNPALMQNQFQRYVTRFVMTGMESVTAPTLAAQLLTLAMGAALNQNNMWVQAFRPAPYASGEFDMHDIGAVGIEANFEGNANGYGSRIDTKADSFKPDSLPKLVAATIKPGLMLSLDVQECGPDTWINGIFAAAAEGNPDANEAILQAANYLTNGEFQKHFPAGGRVAVDENNRIHLGYYTSRVDGARHDIRDIDYLAVLNLVGDKDPEVMRDWSDTFQQTQFPLQQRLAARKRIITGLFGDVTITGFARRVSFESAFIDALIKGCEACRLDIKSVAPYTDVGSYERATASFVGHTLLQSQPSALFNRGGGFAAGQSAVGGNRPFGGGRWF